MKVRTICICCVMLLAASVCCGETYEWQDDRGGIHYTDDPANIPKKYRGRSRAKDVQEADQPAVRSSVGGQTPKAGSIAVPAETFGGLPFASWRDSYQTLRKKDETLRRNLEDARQKYAEARRKKMIYQRARDRQELNQTKEELDRAERAVAENTRQIEQLEADAAKAGVPAGWRDGQDR